jgi:7-carboxy-7-deazaguanine synthase
LPSESLRVNEFFGPTFQGEGPNTGRICHFLRLNRCNQHCKWCDTPYTWADTPTKAAYHESGKIWNRDEQESLVSVEDIVNMLYMERVQFLIVSGGEPLLQAKALRELVRQTDMPIQFETAGTLPPLEIGFEDAGISYVVSPKLANSGNELIRRFRPENLKKFVAVEADFKFVIVTKEDLEEVAKIQQEIGIPQHKMWIMPEGTTANMVITGGRFLAEEALRRGWNLTLRQHTILWGNERGR